LKGVRSGVERQRGRGLKARGGRRDAPGKVLKDWRSPRQRGRMGTSVWDAPRHRVHDRAEREREERADRELSGELREEVREHAVRPGRALAVHDDFFLRAARGKRTSIGSAKGRVGET